MNGKGDKPRPVDKARYDASYERVFGKRCEVHGAHKGDECWQCGVERELEGKTLLGFPLYINCGWPLDVLALYTPPRWPREEAG